MATWLQRIFLTRTIPSAILLTTAFTLAPYEMVYAQELTTTESAGAAHESLNAEYFDAGVFVGVLNIEDFNAEFAQGINVTFNADENYFLQFNYLQADASLSSFETSQGRLFSGSDRKFIHYDFLVGYNIFHGELFSNNSKAKLSTFNVVAGIGETEFGGEGSFTYTYGFGYQVAVSNNLLLKFDYRDYIYSTNIIGENTRVDNTMLSVGLNYLF